MAEQGTAVDAGAAQSGNSGTEIISQAQADAVYEAELAKDTPAPDGDKGGSGDGSDTGNEAEKDTPRVDDADAKAKAEAAKAEAEEQEFVKSLGLDPAKTPKEVIPHLRKMHGEIGRLNNEVNRRGSQNKQVSDQYQAVKRELDTFKNQVNGTPEARLASLKERLGKLDISKLPAGTQKLLNDDEYLMTMATMQTILEGGTPKQDAAASAPGNDTENDLPTEIREQVVKDHPDYLNVYQSQEFAVWMNAQPKEAKEALQEKLKTADGHKEVLAAFKADFKKAVETADKIISDEIVKVHPNFKEKFGDKRFKEWIVKQSRSEQAKLRDTDPRGFIEVLNNFDAYLAAQQSLEQRETERKKKNGALSGLGEVGGGGGITDDLTDEDILNMPDAKFAEFDRKVATGGRK